MLRLNDTTSGVLARCDYYPKEDRTYLRIHICPDSGSDAGEYIIEIPADKCDGASIDAFSRFEDAVKEAYDKKKSEPLQFLESGYDDGSDTQRESAVAAIDDGFARLLALAKSPQVRRTLEGGPRLPNSTH